MNFATSSLKKPVFITIAILGILVFGFQNCSRTKFVPGEGDSAELASSADASNASNQEMLPGTQCEFGGKEYFEDDTVEAFQYSSVPSGNLCPRQIRTCKNGSFTGDFTFADCQPDAATIFQVSLGHSMGRRDFKINSIGLAISGSDCKIQYEKNGTQWEDISGQFSCASDLNEKSIQLPATDEWTNNFNSTGVRIRLVKSSDSSEIAIFPQRVKCLNTGGSPTSTPNLDENCNGLWDDIIINKARCEIDVPNKTYGSAYNCPLTRTCNGKLATFTSVMFMNLTHYYSDSSCTNIETERAHSYGPRLDPATGTIPHPLPEQLLGCTKFGTTNWIYADPTRWSDMTCDYLYDEDPLYF